MVFVTLNRLNQERQEATVKYYERALPQVTEDCIQVIYIADLPASISGLIAVRLSNDLFKPVLCVCNRDPKNLSGSFRSPADLDLTALIADLKKDGILWAGEGTSARRA